MKYCPDCKQEVNTRLAPVKSTEDDWCYKCMNCGTVLGNFEGDDLELCGEMCQDLLPIVRDIEYQSKKRLELNDNFFKLLES